MEVFRIAKEAFSKVLTSSGSANRWNRKGQQVLYAGSSRSLSSLELIVHKGSVVPTETYKVMVISIADEDYLCKKIHIKDLPANWRTFAAYSALQKIGSDWFNKQETLILKVPSAVIPYEYNYIINTEHAVFKDKVHLARTEEYFWDSRLL
ncbi:RES family NAD+ phosphorylase [Paraflavitalea speifideaquila]|uniref:RES family NAD+ phosphorylase n=1 Tax=Paraflavitalea speifideaquila TaxID=3076558 RepID=UPI0028E8E775|nr:RES family NAD+ phosphorylase [Paraflavitalea speifideiaquila]